MSSGLSLERSTKLAIAFSLSLKSLDLRLLQMFLTVSLSSSFTLREAGLLALEVDPAEGPPDTPFAPPPVPPADAGKVPFIWSSNALLSNLSTKQTHENVVSFLYSSITSALVFANLLSDFAILARNQKKFQMLTREKVEDWNRTSEYRVKVSFGRPSGGKSQKQDRKRLSRRRP